jgi:predicted metal-dependent phosphoesterase TrpH
MMATKSKLKESIMRADLHTHTIASDGTHTPAQNVRRAKEKGLKAIAITDHDTTAGLDEALEEAENLSDIEVIPGIEISTVYNKQDIHVLGYFIDYKDESFQQQLTKLRSVRDTRNKIIVEKLNELGIDISVAEVYERRLKKEGNVGRPHIAEVLMEKGIVQSLEEAFDRFLGKGKTAHTNPPRISPFEAVDLIEKAKGVPVIAHPALYEDLQLINEVIMNGVRGIEVYHSDHTTQDEQHFENLARSNNLIMTGGSDYHGLRNGKFYHGDIGNRTVPYEVVVMLKQQSQSLQKVVQKE